MEEKLIFEAFPDSPLIVVRLKNVKNAASVREAIVGKKLAHDAAFVDAQTIPDIFLLHLAAFKALSGQVILPSPCHKSSALSLWSDELFRSLCHRAAVQQQMDVFALRSTSLVCLSCALKMRVYSCSEDVI